MCTDQLKAQLLPKRKEMQELAEKQLAKKPVVAEIKKEGEKDEAIEKDKKDQKDEKPEKDTEMKDEISKTDEKAEATPEDSSYNKSGHYYLKAVLTHKGRSADSGHYVAWVRDTNNDAMWIKFDDSTVSFVNEEEVKKLSGKGGADWHIAYMCVYASSLH